METKRPSIGGEPLAYSLPQLAAAVGISLAKLRQCIGRGELVPSYVGTKPIVTREEALRWLRCLPDEPVRNHR